MDRSRCGAFQPLTLRDSTGCPRCRRNRCCFSDLSRWLVPGNLCDPCDSVHLPNRWARLCLLARLELHNDSRAPYMPDHIYAASWIIWQSMMNSSWWFKWIIGTGGHHSWVGPLYCWSVSHCEHSTVDRFWGRSHTITVVWHITFKIAWSSLVSRISWDATDILWTMLWACWHVCAMFGPSNYFA